MSPKKLVQRDEAKKNATYRNLIRDIWERFESQ